MENFTLIPATDPLCQELQRGHNSYSDGAVICKMSHILDKTGEWLVGPIPDAPNPNEPWANVHPGDNYKALPAKLIDPSGMSPRMNIYFIRMWTRACEECGTAVTYKDNYYNMCTQCGDAQTEGGA